MGIALTVLEFKSADQLRVDRSAIDKIMSYQNEAVVERYAKDHNTTLEEGKAAFETWKKFAITCHFMKGRKTTSREVDDVWHTFLLHTRSYAKFCEDYLGGQFLHHEPTSDEKSPDNYVATRSYAATVFGDIDEKLWPSVTPGLSRCLSGGDCRRDCIHES